MTFGVFAANANAVSPSGCAAYTYALRGFLPYLRAPWYQFSEQQIDDPDVNGGTNPAFPFLTGHGGAFQVAPFGFLGVRTDQSVLFLSPSLPPQIPQLKLRNFYYAGAAFSAFMNATHTALTRIPPVESLNDTFAGEKIPFIVGAPGNETSQTRYTIGVNETVVVPNRLYWQNLTHPGNILQCLPITTPDAYVPGQLPSSANDGAAATSWQPATEDSARLVINTTGVPPRKVGGLFFDFGTRPVTNASVWFFNKTSTGLKVGTQVEVDGLGPNLPPVGSSTVVPVVDNTTTMVLDPSLNIWTGDWVELTIEGCSGCDTSDGALGGTIAEFVVY